jgi:integrase
VQKAAGVVTKNGRPKYVFHSLRHFFASLCINPRERGGFGLSPKEAQELLGHSDIGMTFNTYGHLFPRSENNTDKFDAVTSRLLA